MARSFRLLLCASTAVLALSVAAPVVGFVAPAQAQVDVVISAAVPPPALPVYAQPPIPGLGYIWIPGYWAWDGQEYYWAPGYWAMPPAADLYWTPGYWAWDDADNDYAFYAGYWGPTVGFYGGIDYGYGYTGDGYHGGYWRNRQFFYNQAVNNLAGVRIANVYRQPLPAIQPNGVAFNGGRGGTTVRATPHELALARAHHIGPTAAQMRHVALARQTPALRFSRNHGIPPIAATDRAGTFHGAHVVAAQGGHGAHGGPAEHVGAVAAAGAAAGAAGALAAHGAMNRAPVMHHQPGATAALGGHHMRQMRPENAPAARGVGAREAAGAPHRFAAHGPMHGQEMQRNFAHAPMHAREARPHVAAHGPTMRAPAAPRNFAREPHMRGGPAYGALRMAHPGPMRVGGAPHMGAPAHFGAPHVGGVAGGPRFAHGGFGGPPRMGGMGGAPHFGGGAPHIGRGGPHMGGGHGAPGVHVP